jgi:hypothetical protein
MNTLALNEKTRTGTNVSEYTPKFVRYLTQYVQITRMGREINLDSIVAWDAEIIRLKRTRNSLLNIARIPPEILGHIFHFNITEDGDPDFAGIPKGSYNFLLVCHHWSQVALRTPELWSSWGNNLKDWKRWYLRSGTFALDLILDDWNHECEDFDEVLRDAIRDRAARGIIRKVHLESSNTGLLTTIISSLIPEGEDVRPSSIESIVLSDVDVSDLFTRHRFPKLRNLCLLNGSKISSWDHLKSTTTTLTNLSLIGINAAPPSPAPTTSQIISFLASNPNLRSLTLIKLRIDDDGGDGPRPKLSLRHLKRISLLGAFHSVSPILHRLDFPERMDHGEISLHKCTPQEVIEVIGPYIRDYLRRDPRFRNRPGIYVSSTPRSISFCAGVVGVGYRGPNRLPQNGPPYGKFEARLSQDVPRDVRKKVYVDVLALLPRESIVDFGMDLPVTEDILVVMPNLETLHLADPVVSDGFLLPDPSGPNADKKLLPSLRQLYLEYAKAENDSWDPLVTYLAHQTSGGQAISIKVFGEGLHICSKVIERIEDLVEDFSYELDPDQECPFDECPHAV